MTFLDLQAAPEPWRPPEGVNNVWLEDRNGESVIVFVHGFRSDSRGCWYNSEARTYWPAMMRDAYPHYSIFLGGYKTGTFSGDYQLSNCADELWTALSVPIAGARPVLERQRIVFIAHSLGGIVVRRLLIQHREELLSKEIGLMLMASPSLGSGWANAGAGLAQLFGNRIGELLQKNSSLLIDLHSHFRHLTHDRKLPGLHGMECAEDIGLVSFAPPIVSLLSAGQYFGETHRLPDTDHLTCVKPGDHCHPAWRAGQRFLQEFDQHCKQREEKRQESFGPFSTYRDSFGGSLQAAPNVQRERRTGADDPAILRIFGNASEFLLQWPQETQGRWLPRPELDQLRLRIRDQNHSLTALLGPPGSGKSALLARLGSELRGQGTALLALKADSIPREAGTLDKLNELLGVPAKLAECILQLAATRPVVLLIDQVDALADLMDLHSGRLNVLLALTSLVRGIDGVHIIVSCREFEFKHDARFHVLQPEEIRLADPAWVEVQAIIVEAGLQANNWPEETRKILCRPQHLNVFLRYRDKLGSLPPFRTYQAMLERIIQERVRPLGDDVNLALHGMAVALAEEEDLWLPVARFEAQYPQEIRTKLLSTDLVMLSPEGVKVGFAHQTVFDFVRARAFTAGNASLAKHVLERQDALFVRPTLWSSLTYLREADRNAYLQEFSLMWDTTNLRPHVRYLLISYLGQVPDPTPREVGWLTKLTDDPKLCRKALKATEGSPAWFAKLLPRLPALMSASPETAAGASRVLAAAFAFDRDAAISLIEANWRPFPEHDALTIGTLMDLKDWDERSFRIADEVLARTPMSEWVKSELIKIVSRSKPEFAAELAIAEVARALHVAESISGDTPSAPVGDGSNEEKATHLLVRGAFPYSKSIEKMVSAHRWDSMPDVAKAAPRTFTEQFWPVLRRIAQGCASSQSRVCNEYVDDFAFQLTRRRFRTGDGLTTAIEAAVLGFARATPNDFLAFVRQHESDDLLVTHRLMSRGLAEIAGQLPDAVANYLMADSRRLAMDSDTCRLISAVSSHLAEPARSRLEHAITGWNHRTAPADMDAYARRGVRQRNRADRLRLLRCFSNELLSPAGQILIQQEERALPEATQTLEPFAVGECVGSPMTLEQMRKASDDDLMNLFDELTDSTVYDRPRSFGQMNLQGGSIQTSQVFCELAEADPKRAFGLLSVFKPQKHERYAASAISGVSQATDRSPTALIDAVHDLARRGFQSDAFRREVANCLGRLASTNNGLDDLTCNLLESWLQQGSDDRPIVVSHPRSDDRRSILCGENTQVTSSTNAQIMLAHFAGYRNRESPAYDAWLEILERHLDRGADLATWDALAKRELHFLHEANRERAVALVSRLLHRDDFRNSHAAAILLASTHWWLPQALVHWCLDQWQSCDWDLGPQAAAEIAMVRVAFVPDDTVSAVLVDRVLSALPDSDERAKSMLFGVASMAAELWNDPRARTAATGVLLRLIPIARGAELANTAMVAFDRHEAFRLDSDLLRLLRAVVDNPEVIRHGHCDGAIAAVQHMLASEGEPELAAQVAAAVLKEAGPKVADFSTRWAAVAGELTKIAISLQHFSETRAKGLDLFENLMEVDAYPVADLLKDIDRRPV